MASVGSQAEVQKLSDATFFATVVPPRHSSHSDSEYEEAGQQCSGEPPPNS